MATLDTGKIYTEEMAKLGKATEVLAKAKEASKEASKERGTIKAALKLPGLDKATEAAFTARLAKLEESSGMSTTRGDDASGMLTMLASIPGALTDAQKAKATESVNAFTALKPTRKTRGEGNGRAESPGNYVPGPLSVTRPDGSVVVTENSIWSSIYWAILKDVRVRSGRAANDKSMPNAWKASQAAARQAIGTLKAPGKAKSAVVTTSKGDYTITRVESVSHAAKEAPKDAPKAKATKSAA